MEHEIKMYAYGKNNMPITKLYGYGEKQNWTNIDIHDSINNFKEIVNIN